MERGTIIAIEGTDGSGKATQTQLLIERLNAEGFPTESMSFPRYQTPTGRIVGQAYLGKEREEWQGDSGWFEDATGVDPMIASLYYAADRVAAVPEMERILEAGKHLVLDRYVYSNMAHQGAKLLEYNDRRTLFKTLGGLEFGTLKLPRPEATLLLYAPSEVTKRLRIERGELDQHETNEEYMKRAEETYLQLAKFYGMPVVECIAEGQMRTREDIAEEVYQRVLGQL